MSFETHGFFTGGPKKILEDCGHILLGHCPTDLLWYAREWTTAKLPWPFKGQWPPGDIHETDEIIQSYDGPIRVIVQWVRLDRVADSGRDEFGRSIGAQLRPFTVAFITYWVAT